MSKVIPITDSPRQRARLVDELGRLAARVASFKPHLDRLAELKKIVAGWAAGKDAEEELRFAGKRYEATVSPREFEREVQNMHAVYDSLGHEEFLKRCSFALKFLDVFIPDALDRGIVSKERTGSRKVTVEPRQPRSIAA